MAVQDQEAQSLVVPFLDQADLRPGQEALLTKDQIFLNGFFEPVKGPLGTNDFYFIKRPGTSVHDDHATHDTGRGCFAWKQTAKVYAVVGNKIYSDTTDLGVTLSGTTGFVNFEETRPGAPTPYLGVNDGNLLVLIAADDSVIILNNKPITGITVANPTHITVTGHGLNTGNKIIIRNCTTVTPASINDTIYTITKIDANNFTIPLNVTAVGAGPFGTLGVFPAPNTADLHYMDTYWFTMKDDGSIWNCAPDDPTNWPTGNTIFAQMLPGHGIGLGKQNNVLIGFSDRHYQMFITVPNPVFSPLQNVEQAMQRIGCISTNTIAYQENTTYWVSNTLTGGYSIYRLDGTANPVEIGNATVNRSLTNNFLLTPGSPSAKVVILTGSGNWTVPADFNKSNNTIEAIGAGGGGSKARYSSNGAFGGGGGAYAKINNFDPLGAGTIPFSCGVGGAGANPGSNLDGNGSDGTDTIWNTSSLIAKAGKGALYFSPGAGGLASASTGTVKRDGGTGGNGSTRTANVGQSGGGGGGAAGKFSSGQNGFNGTNGSTGSGGNGGQGDPSAGGAGGTGGTVGGFIPTGSDGNPGTEYTTAGSGGGGGGGGCYGTLGQAASAGNAGLYGAGGGGTGSGNEVDVAPITVGGNGSNGVIVVTYVPAGPTDANAANGYILRIQGHIFYVLNLVNNKETWVYDQDTHLWTKWTSGVNSDGIFPVVTATLHVPAGTPGHVVGQDPATGQLWKVDPLAGDDAGVNFEYRIQTNPITFGSLSHKYYDRVYLIGDKPVSSTPILVSYSDDNYITFSTPRSLDISQKAPFLRALGESRRRSWRISYTGSNIIRLHGIEFTYSLGRE